MRALPSLSLLPISGSSPFLRFLLYISPCVPIGRNFSVSVRFNYMVCFSLRSAVEASPRTQTALRRGPPRPPKKTARGLQDGEGGDKGDSKLELSTVVTNAKMTWSELLVLNGRGPDVKREELETSLDRSILALRKIARLKKRIKESELQTVMDTLKCIHDYRLRFPRSNAANHKLSEQAQEVLDEM